MVKAGVGIKVPPTSPNQFPPASTHEHLPIDYQQTATPPNTTLNEKSTARNITPNDTSSNFTLNDNSFKFKIIYNVVERHGE